VNKRYNELDQCEKINALALTAEIIKLNPEALGNSSAFGELLDKLEKHAVELSDRFHGKLPPPPPSKMEIYGAHSPR